MGTTTTATRSIARSSTARRTAARSLAEAKLDARIKPDIAVLRSVTSYPRRYRPALAVLPGGLESDETATAATAMAGAAIVPIRTAKEAAAPAGSVRPAEDRRVPRAASSGPIRLTRRGKVVVSAVGAIAMAALAALIWFGIAGRAQAAAHLQPGPSGASGMLRVVVQPGQTLWSIAVLADPAADPRTEIQAIIDDNSLTSTTIRAGQVLWVPRA